MLPLSSVPDVFPVDRSCAFAATIIFRLVRDEKEYNCGCKGAAPLVPQSTYRSIRSHRHSVEWHSRYSWRSLCISEYRTMSIDGLILVMPTLHERRATTLHFVPQFCTPCINSPWPPRMKSEYRTRMCRIILDVGWGNCGRLSLRVRRTSAGI